MAKQADDILILASGKRLYALALFAVFCFIGGVFQMLPLAQEGQIDSFWGRIFVLMCVLFLAWAIAALWIALRQPTNAYRLTEEGLYIGAQSSPAFTWDQVKGATLMRGKRRSHITVVLVETATLNRAGLIPDFLAALLGRPSDRDVALSNMGTAMDL